MTGIDYHLPTIIPTKTQFINRVAASIGSLQYAADAAHADYNGHRYDVEWLPARGYYVARYFWAGSYTIARGSLEACVQAALRAYGKGAAGSSVRFMLRNSEDADTLVDLVPDAILGKESRSSFPWYMHGERGTVTHHAVRANQHHLILRAESLEDFDRLQAEAHQERLYTQARHLYVVTCQEEGRTYVLGCHVAVDAAILDASIMARGHEDVRLRRVQNSAAMREEIEAARA